MDVLDKFFTKYSYKFPKGYPDLKDKQDILLIESILEDEFEHIQLRKLNPEIIDRDFVHFDSNGKRYVIDYFRERIPTFDVPEKIIEYAKKYSPVRRVTIETVAAQEMVRDMVTRMAAQDRRLIPGIFKGVRPPAGIKKADRLETSLGPVVNSKKLYIRREMTEIVDEFFEHPLPRHDDILDALYYADYFSKSPRSASIGKDMYENVEEKPKVIKRAYNWMTGAKI